MSSDYDILISAYNLCDFGVPAIHLLDLSWDEELRRRFAPPPSGLEGIFHRVRVVRGGYLALARIIARPSGRDLFSGEDHLFAYSRWIASIIERNRGVTCGVLYPPVPDSFSNKAFQTRSNAFVCLGRVSEEKRLERVVDILSGVRAQGHNVTLHVIGRLGPDSYARKFKAFASRAPWILLEGDVTAERKAHLLSTCRYGIHGADGEGFGIAVAEMIKAGCIAFAPVQGGPAEILDHDALLYSSVDDAVEKIISVLTDRDRQIRLLEHLLRQAAKFSAENFMCDIRLIVSEFVTSRSRSRVARPIRQAL
jgi:glycosyltransferase involved in cell wall biosynthesis